MRDLYNILNIQKNSSETDIKKAYKKLAQKHHPDKGGDEEKFKEIQHAYDILKNSEKREIYDNYGEEGLDNSGPSMDPFTRSGGFGGMDPFSMFFDMHNMHNAGNSRRRKEKCDHVVVNVHYTLDQLYRKDVINKKAQINIICPECNGAGGSNPRKCSDCQGNGFKTEIRQIGPGMIQQSQRRCGKCSGDGSIIDKKCKKCSGNKTVRKELNFNVSVDYATTNGKQVIYRDKGNEYPNHLQGDIVFVFIEKPHPVFKRVNGNNLYMKKQISLVDALCGCKFSIEHLNGRKVDVSVNNVTKPNSQKVVKQEGLHNGSDLIIEFEVLFPDNIVKDRNGLEEIFK